MLEMMFTAPTNGGKHITSNNACAHCQQYTNDSVLRLVQMTLCIIRLRNYPPFFEPTVISDGPTNRLIIRQFKPTSLWKEAHTMSCTSTPVCSMKAAVFAHIVLSASIWAPSGFRTQLEHDGHKSLKQCTCVV